MYVSVYIYIAYLSGVQGMTAHYFFPGLWRPISQNLLLEHHDIGEREPRPPEQPEHLFLARNRHLCVQWPVPESTTTSLHATRVSCRGSRFRLPGVCITI